MPLHTKRTTMSVIEHVDLPISGRPKPNRAIEPFDQKDNAIAPHRRAAENSFFWAMQLVPLQRREAMHAVYAFCRKVDDIADSDASRSLKQILLGNWRSEIGLLFAGRALHDVTLRLSEAVHVYGLRCDDFLAIIDGM